jgi:hypothetical protein
MRHEARWQAFAGPGRVGACRTRRDAAARDAILPNGRQHARAVQSCKAAHISLSRSAVQMRGFLMPLASS